MVDFKPLEAAPVALRSPLHGTSPVTTVSASGVTRGVVIAEQPAGLVIQIIARRGKASETVAALRTHFALAASDGPARCVKNGVVLVGAGPGQWLLMADAADGAAIETKAKAVLADVATLADQSHARVHLHISGPRARDALAKLVGIDLDTSVFAAGAAAMTVIAHIPVHIWRLDDIPEGAVFEIAAPHSYAASLWHYVVTAAAEFGLDARSLDPMSSGPH